MNKDFFKLGIIGKPLSHSISPSIQESALLSKNLKGSYEKFEVDKEDLGELIDYFKKNDFSGFNVTIPYKTEIIKYLDEVDEGAQKIGAVNTVKISADKILIGFNTDIYGFYSSFLGISGLKKSPLNNAVMLGCGGAALSVVFGLEKLGCEELVIYARNLDKAAEFINNIKDKTKMRLFAQKLELISSLSNTDILVNATPLGTKGENENMSPVNGNIFLSAKKSMIVYDLVYNPQETELLKIAKEQGLYTINGLDMLLLQGAKAFEIWTGVLPEISVMRTAALKELL